MNKNQNRFLKAAASLCVEIDAEDGIAPRFLKHKRINHQVSAKSLQPSHEALRLFSSIFASNTLHLLLHFTYFGNINQEVCDAD